MVKKPHLLIVDDEVHVTRSLERSLRDQFQVTTANSAKEALSILSNQQIEVILTDQRMPDMTGVELLKVVREKYPFASGILLSGYSDSSALVDAINIGGVRGFIPKPWDLDILRTKLREAVQIFDGLMKENGKTGSVEGNYDHLQLEEIKNILAMISASAVDSFFQPTSVGTPSLFEGRSFNHQFLDRMQDGFAAIQADGKLIFCNQVFFRMLSIPEKAQSEALTLDDLTHFPEIFKAIQNGLHGIHTHSSCKINFPEGNQSLLEIGAAPVSGQDNQFQTLLVIRDQTEREKTIAHLRAMNAVAAALSQSKQFTDSLRLTLQACIQGVNADAVVTYFINPDGISLHYGGSQGLLPGTIEFLSQHNSILCHQQIENTMLAGGARTILDTHREEFLLPPDLYKSENIVSAAAVPMHDGNGLAGLLAIYTRTIRIFDANDLDLLTLIGDQIAIFRLNEYMRIKTEREIQYQAAQLQVLSDASRAFVEASLQFEAVLATLDTFARRIAELFGDTCIITLLSNDRQWVPPIIFYNQDPKTLDFLRQSVFAAPFRVGEGIAASVVQTGRSILIENISQEELRAELNSNFLPFIDRYGIHSLLIVPMLIQGKVIGTIGLFRDTPGNGYQLQDQLFLQDLADRAALTVHNARLFEETRRSNDQLVELHSSLNRSHTLIAALSQMAVQIQHNLNPAQIWDIIGVELKKLKVVIFIGLLEPNNHRMLEFSYCSIEPQRLLIAENILGLDSRGLKISIDDFPGFSTLMEERKRFFVADTLAWVHRLFPESSKNTIQQVYQRVGFTPNTRAINLPLILDQGILGIMSVWGDELEESDVPSFSVFSGQVIATLENARLFKITTEHTEQLKALTARLAETEELERRKFALELHDQVGQTLTALGINVNVIHSLIPPENNGKALRLVDDSMKLIEEAVERTRDIMTELRPPILDDYGLLAALRWNAEQFAARTGLEILVDGDDSIFKMPVHVESALFRISQEVLMNVVKHAHAQKVHIFLSHERNLVLLTIEDNGKGFDPGKILQPERKPTWGLLSIRERAEAVGGYVKISSSPGNGTVITIEVEI